MTVGNAGTPFLELRSFVRGESEVFPSEALTPALGSPFVSVYELEGRTEFFDPEQEAYSSLVQELYDEEFDEALFELMTSARGLHEEHMVSGTPNVEGERLLQQHFNQLIRETENSVTAFAREFGSRDAATLGANELDAFADRYTPASAMAPEFEEFFSKWKKKLVNVAKKVGKFALKVGLGPALEQAKSVIKPMLNRVLQMAIGKLPEAVRPAAQLLADKIFKRVAKKPEDAAAADAAAAPADAAPDATADAQPAAGPSVTDIQQEFDQQLANLFLASDEVDMELEVARVRSADQNETVPVYAELDQARERFVNELQQLREGEDPTPYVQNFLPAVLPALRLGIKLAGRNRIVTFLANLLAKLIAKLIGPESAPALSRAIVDAGLKLLTLEVSAEDEARAAASSVAATVEETVRRVSALPEYVLDNQELLEGFAVEAFERAAAANLPPVLSEAVYRERPDLRETQNAQCWVMLPLRRTKRYKKYGRTFKVRISPYIADEIESFEGPLADYLQDQLGVEESAEVEAEVSLYETLPGTTLPDIARAESAGAKGAAQFHPLTPKAAGLLLGEPRMGRSAPRGSNRRRVGVGQRFYRLSIPGRRLLVVPAVSGSPQPRRLGGVRVTLDCPKDEIRLRIFLSEIKAQRLAVKLRRQSHAGAVAVSFQSYVAKRLAPILRGERVPRIRVIQSGLLTGDALGDALKRLPADVAAALTAKLQECVVRAFAEFAKTQSQQFVTAAEDTADGVTLKFTISGLAGLQQLGKALLPNGSATGLAAAIQGGNTPNVQVVAGAGYRRD